MPMGVTSEQSKDWRQWLLTTSIPLVQLDAAGQVLGLGSGSMIDHNGRRFLVTAGHVATLDSNGWAIVVQQNPNRGLEYYRPRAFVHVGEYSRKDASMRLLDLCVAEVPAHLETWYEFRTPRGLFDRRAHQVFGTDFFAAPESTQIFGFAGQVRTEMHGLQTFVSEMTVFPGLSYLRTEVEEHHFALPVVHPGHEAFHGSSGSPICDFSRRLAAIVVRGDANTSCVIGVDIQRVIPALHFLAENSPMQQGNT